MADPQQKARDADRKHAVRVVEAASGAGRITQPDRDLRLERLRHAGTKQDVEMVVRDLPAVASSATVGQAASRPRVLAPRTLGWMAALAGFGVLAVGGVLGSANQDKAQEATSVLQAPEARDLTSATGYEQLVLAVERRTGDTEVFGATLDGSGYALVDLPVGATGQEFHVYRWDGRWRDRHTMGQSEVARFDLSRISPAGLEQVVQEAESQVRGAATSYVLVNPGRKGVCFTAYASDETGASVRIDARCDGTIKRG